MPFGDFGRFGGRSKSLFPTLAEEEEQSAIDRLLSGPMSALQYIGATLDKPGRAVRGLIGGRPEELANLIPFSDSLGITHEGGLLGGTPLQVTSSDNQLSGRDLLESAGILDPNETGLDWGDAAGFAAEVVTDPLTFFNPLKGLSQAGKAAQKIGTASSLKTIVPEAFGATTIKRGAPEATEIAREVGLGGSREGLLAPTRESQILAGQAGYGTFLGSDPMFTGSGAQKVGRFFDTLGDTIKYKGKYNPVPLARGLLSPEAGNFADPRVQEFSEFLQRPLADELLGKARAPVLELKDEYDALNVDPMMEPIAQRFMNQAGDLGVGAGAEPVAGLQSLADRLQGLAVGTRAAEVAQGMKTPAFSQSREVIEQGLDTATGMPFKRKKLAKVDDPLLRYSPREVTPPELGAISDTGIRDLERGRLKTTHGQQIQRKDWLRWGTKEDVNDVVREWGDVNSPLGASIQDRVTEIMTADPTMDMLKATRQAEIGALAERMNVRHGYNAANPEHQVQFEKLLQKDAARFRNFLKKSGHAESGTPLFGNTFAGDVLNRVERSAHQVAKAETVNNLLARYATPQGEVKLDKALSALGLDKEGVAVGKLLGIDDPKQLKTLGIDKKLFHSIANPIKLARAPEMLQPLLEGFERASNMFKGFVTSLGPFAVAFNARNIKTAITEKYFDNAMYPGKDWVTGAAQPVIDAYKAAIGQEITGAAKRFFPGQKMTDAEATLRLKRAAYAHNAIGGKLGPTDVATDKKLSLLEEYKNVHPPLSTSVGHALTGGAFMKDPKLANASLGGWNPFQGRGTGGPSGQLLQESTFRPQVAGEELTGLTEFVNRFGHFLGKKAQGFVDSEAAKATRLSQFDYQDLTEFERGVMKKLVPFYCVPDHSTILTRDGWKTCDEVKVGQEVLSYNIETDRLEWQPCLDVAIFDHDQELTVISNTIWEIECTAEHRWAIEKPASSITHSYGSYNYPAKRVMIETKDLNKNGSLIVSAPLKDGGDSLLTPAQARLLGWIVTDGSCRRRGNYIEAVIYQHPKKFLKEVIEVAGGSVRAPHPDTGCVCVAVLKERKEEILPYLMNKQNLSKVVTRLNREAAEAMYDAMYKGDGTTAPGRQQSFAAQDEGVREAFRILAVMLGKRTGKIQYKDGVPKSVYVSNFQRLNGPTLSKTQRHFKGRVWCPRTANGTWVMQQNGFITITGNTFASRNLPRQFQHLFERPGLSSGLLRTTDLDKGEYTPKYLSGGVAIPLSGEDETGTQRFLTSFGLPQEQAFSLFGVGPGAVGYTVNQFASQLNPYLKLPAELFTGRQFYSGRELEDLRPFTGVQALDQALFNSPLTKAISAGKTLTDERKGIGAKAFNLLSGFKLSDVDVEKQRRRDAKDLAEELLKKNDAVRSLDVLTVPRERAGELSPEEAKLMQLLNTLRQRR